jgi:Fe-S cluster biogenesis protein NfuA
MNDPGTLRQVGDRIERLLEEIRGMTSPPAREKVEELVSVVVNLYGRGLERVLEVVAEAPESAALIDRLAADRFLASLFVLHGIHPVGVEERIQEALDRVRPYLGSHAGGVEFLGVDEQGVARLKLEGSCDGCPSSLVTVRVTIERAIEEAAPEVTRIDVEGVTGAPADDRPALIQIEPFGGATASSRPAGEPMASRLDTWTRLDGVGELSPGRLTVVDVGGASVLVCRIDGNLYAYRNACSSCASPLEKAELSGELLTCPRCRQRYDVRLAGRSPETRDLHLEPLPLLAEGGDVRIAVVA